MNKIVLTFWRAKDRRWAVGRFGLPPRLLIDTTASNGTAERVARNSEQDKMPSSSCCVGAAKNARRPREVYCYILILIINIIIIIIVNIALSFVAGAANLEAGTVIGSALLSNYG
uniref:Uncharacterized protein n=1 Tax=Anopheles melas TaxID=34690 RepID=A0A182TND5_9DIPT